MAQGRGPVAAGEPVVRVVDVTQWFTESFRAEFEKQADQIGRINLAVFGKTGVGKSTLVNAIFGEPVAVTGIGAPVTIGSHLYLDKRGALGVVDTRGLELGHDDDQIIKELTKAIKESRGKPVSEQIHVAWYCIRGMDRRFEDFEERFIRTLDDARPAGAGRAHPGADARRACTTRTRWSWPARSRRRACRSSAGARS